VETENCQINRSSRVTLSTTKRRIGCPPYSRSLLYKSANNLQGQSCRQHPKADVIHTRKSHIWRPDHHGDEPVTEPAHKSGHHYKKLHKLPMGGNLYIVKLSITSLNTRPNITKFHTDLLTHSSCDNTDPSSKNKVHHTNVFCICAAKPSNKKVIPLVRIFFHLAFTDGLCHYSLFCSQSFLIFL
jgi:hypothetical protein